MHLRSLSSYPHCKYAYQPILVITHVCIHLNFLPQVCSPQVMYCNYSTYYMVLLSTVQFFPPDVRPSGPILYPFKDHRVVMPWSIGCSINDGLPMVACGVWR